MNQAEDIQDINNRYNHLAQSIYELVKKSFSIGELPQFGAFVFLSNLEHPPEDKTEDNRKDDRLMFVYHTDQPEEYKRVYVKINQLEMSRAIFSNSKPHAYYMTGMTDRARKPQNPTHPDIRKYQFHLVVPVFNAIGRAIGLISLHAMRENAFTTDDAMMLRNIADHVSEKLDDIEQSIHRLNQMKIINQVDKDIIRKIKIGQEGGEKSRKEIWEFVLEQLCKLTGASSGSIFRVNDNQETMIRESIYASSSDIDVVDRFPIDEEFNIETQHEQKLSVEMAFLYKKSKIKFLHIKSKEERPNHDYESALSVPIIGDEPTLKGIITLVSDKQNHFDADDVALAQTLAGQAAVATWAVEQVNRFYDMVTTSHEFTKKSFDKVLESILETIIDIFDPTGKRNLIGTLRRVNIFTNTLDLVSSYPDKLSADITDDLKAYFEKSKHFPIEEQLDSEKDTRKPHGLVGRVVCDCRRYIINDTDNPEELTDETRDYLAMPNVRSIMSVGIWGKSADGWDAFQKDADEQAKRVKRDNQPRHAVRGVISIMSPVANEFTDIEFEILTYFSNMIALVWAYHLQKNRIEVLMDIAEEWQKGTIRDMGDLKIWDKVQRIFTIGATKEDEDDKNRLGARGTFSEYRVDGKLIWKRASDEEHGWLPDYTDEIDVFNSQQGFNGKSVQAWVAYHNLRGGYDFEEKQAIIANIPNTTVQSGYLEVSYPKANPRKAYILKQSKNDPGLYRNAIVYPFIDDDGQKREFRTRSELCVPIIDTDGGMVQLRGLINVESPTAYAFDEDDEKIIEALARQVWNALIRIDYQIGEDSEDYIYHIAASTHKLKDQLNSIIEEQEKKRDFQTLLDSLKEMYANMKEVYDIEKALAELKILNTNDESQPYSLKKVLQGVFDEIDEGKTKGVTLAFQYDIDDTIYLTESKYSLLKLIFDNFFKNSIKHCRSDRQLNIIVTIQKTNVTNMLEIKVRDNGKGIPIQDQYGNKVRETIFFKHKYGSESDSKGSMGIGLFLTKKTLTHKLGGGINTIPDTKHKQDYPQDFENEDEYETYTEFTLWLPRQ